MRWAAALLFAATPGFAEVPIAIAPSGHATVPVAGQFGVRQFVFDTGAEGSAIYSGFADEVHMPPAGKEVLQGQTGESEAELLKVAYLAVDGVRKDNIDAVRLDPRSDGVPLAGIVGLDIFGDRTLVFDLPNKRLVLLRTGQRPMDLAGEGILATPTVGNLLTVPVSISGVAAVAVIDTGARKTRINWKLGRALGIDPDAIAKGEMIQGATNNAVETGATEVRNVRLGTRALAAAPVLVADLPVFESFGVANRPAVILGLDWLTSTRMVVDFPARRVWFEGKTNPD